MDPTMTPGYVLADKYRIERELGSGGMARVFQVMHLQLGERAAIKVLRSDVAHVEGAVERFSREARAMSRLKSEHVARVQDVGLLPSGQPYMVMEFLEGQDLASTIESHGPLAPQPAVDLLLQACEAIAEAHARGIVHRDLKPSNLFLTSRADGVPSIKVLDFGISKFSSGNDASDALSLTHTQALLGSPLYMSPEQIASARDADARTDLWGLGTILYELLCKVPPFYAQTLRHLQYKILHEEPPSLRTLNPAVPPGLEAAVLRCLAKEPDARFPDPGALASALEPFASKHGIHYVDRIRGIVSRSSLNDSAAAVAASPQGGQGIVDAQSQADAFGHAPTFDISEQGASQESATDPKVLHGTRGAWSGTPKQSHGRSRIGLALAGVVGVLSIGILAFAGVRHFSDRAVVEVAAAVGASSPSPITTLPPVDDEVVLTPVVEPAASHSAALAADQPPRKPPTGRSTAPRTTRNEPPAPTPERVEKPGGLFDTRK